MSVTDPLRLCRIRVNANDNYSVIWYKLPVSVAVIPPLPADLPERSPAQCIRLGAHQRLGERLNHCPQQVRACLLKVLARPPGRFKIRTPRPWTPNRPPRAVKSALSTTKSSLIHWQHAKADGS
jgi:hypothetical protein